MKKVLFLAVPLLSLLFSGCLQPVNQIPSSNPGGTLAPAETNGVIQAYVLKEADPLHIRFNGIADQQFLETAIDENGQISLLHLQPIKAAGMTTTELEEKIEDMYVDGGIYKHVSVNVTMTAKTYYVQGYVYQPGQFELMSGTTLLQAIASARGPTDFANKKKVRITRQGQSYHFNLKELEKDPSKDVKIEAGDIIYVPDTWY